MKVKLLIVLSSLFLLAGCNVNKEKESTESTKAKSSKVIESTENSVKKETNKAVIEVEK